jgi:UDP-glucose 4-epimerase
MRAFVTGVAGFIGSTLAERLLEDGADVVGLDCFADYYPRLLKERNLSEARRHPRFRFVEARIQDADLKSLLADRTHVFHLAAQAGVRKSWGRDFSVYTRTNVEATQILLEACAGLTLERVVYSSSSSVYGDSTALPMREDALPQPVSPYGVTKLAGEQLCHLYFVSEQVPTVSLRYFTVYGPRQRPDMGFHRFLRATLRGEPITVYGDGEQTRDFTFVHDAVAANIAAAARGVPGRVYNIGGGSRVSINQVLEIIARVSGRRPIVRVDPAQKGDMRHTYADTSLAHADLGFAPAVGLEEGLAAEHAWLADLLAATAACASAGRGVPPGTIQPDKFLFDRGTEDLNNRKWLTAREFFREIVDSYPQSPYRPDAKLGLGDAYLGEATPEALQRALIEFREFLGFFPTNPRADYAQYKLGMVHFKQMRGPQRDQTETRDAVSELQRFVDRYPNSQLLPEVQARLREARDRLSESDYLVGFFYYRQRWYPGAVDRFKDLLQADPDFSHRDAVYFHLGEALLKTNRKAEALPYFEKLVQEFEQSEYLTDATKRIAELKGQSTSS